MKRLLLLGALLVFAVPASAARLPVLASHDWWPVFSPDTKHVAYTTLNGQGRVLTLKVVDASNPKHPVRALARSSSQLLPTWSPDSKQIAYQSGGRIWTVRIDGSGRRSLHAGLTPAWAPDGSTIAYVAGGQVHAGTALLGTNVVGVPAWSPDATRIAWAQPDGVYAATIAGGVTQKLAAPVAEVRSLAWSPDATTIAYTSGAYVYAVPADGSSAATRVAGPFADLGPLAWAPASDTLAYTVRGGVEISTKEPSWHSALLVKGAAVGTSFGPGDPHGEILAYSGPMTGCPGHDAIRLFDDGVLAGSCAITGTAGADVIYGTSSWGDAISAGAGNDAIHANDGHTDRVNCGPGRDTVWADRTDKLVGCEIVHR